MKNFNRSAITAALLITLGAAYSVNASAAETSQIENTLSEMILAQGQQVMSDLSMQLQTSIAQKINNFSTNFSLTNTMNDSLNWITEENQLAPSQQDNQTISVEKNLTTHINTLK